MGLRERAKEIKEKIKSGAIREIMDETIAAERNEEELWETEGMDEASKKTEKLDEFFEK